MAQQPSTPGKGRRAFVELMRSVNERYPHAAYIGFAFWLAWSKIVWTAVSDCMPQGAVADGMASGARVHIVTNIALLFVIIGAAALERHLGQLPERPSFLVWGGSLATLGTAALLCAVGFGLPSAAFDLSCAVTGVGMGMLLIRCMLLLGALVPQRILLVVAVCASFSAVLSALSVSLPAPVVVAVGCLAPAASAAFLALAHFPPQKAHAAPRMPDRSAAVRPPRAFWQFIFTVFLIALVAESMVYFNNCGASSRSTSIRYADIAVMFVTAGLIVYAAIFPKSYNYGKMYYPIAFLIMVLLGVLFAMPGDSPVNMMMPLAAYQLLSMLVWCLSACVVQQSKVSPITAFGFGYGAQMVGSVIGYLVGHQLNGALEAQGVNLLLFYLVVAAMVIALSMAVYPPRAMRDLLLSIPDDDLDESVDVGNFATWEHACGCIAEKGGLTLREREVMALLARGRGSAFISESLGVALATVYTHTRNIYRKLGVHSREELMRLVDGQAETGPEPKAPTPEGRTRA